ncbi:FAD-dependent oxidoreductase [Cellulosimicrobium funkei]|nr:FAD-dependent oxidoreductase [Cellulosimicrobium funkei]
MKVVVLGATGTIGTLITTRLREFGHEVVAASRSSGVDAVTGDGLAAAFAGADAVVDALNRETLSAAAAIEYFTTTAGNVCAAARRAGVGRLVCVSIAGAADPAVNKAYGYYRGKAAQEHAYRSSGLPVTIIHSTQWFELVPTILRRTTVGPVAVLPTMRMAAVSAASVARLVADEVARKPDGRTGHEVREVAIRGPEVATAADVARRMLAVWGSLGGKSPKRILEVPLFGRAIASGGLIPEDGLVDEVTLEQWLAGTRPRAVRDAYDYVIVGAGMAAAKAIDGIRAEDQTGSIGVFGEDPSAPVYRPDLSKTLWLKEGASVEESLMLSEAPGAATSPDESTELHLGTTVTSLTPDDRSLALDGGQRVRYGKLLLATGAAPRMTGLEPGSRVIYYRTVDDFRRLRELARPGAHVVVVGGGYIGTELAAVLTQNGVRVTLVVTSLPLLAHLFPESLAQTVTREFSDRGVDLVVGRLDGGTSRRIGVTVHLEDGADIAADAAVVGVGVFPRTELAQAAGLAVDDGILVDDHLRTAAHSIYAAGDVARYPDRLLGVRRVEHAVAAETMGTVAGRNMAGADRPYRTTPFFWSDLFGFGYEAVGEVDTRHRTVEDWAVGDDGQPDHSTGVVYCVNQIGAVRGVLLWNVWESVKPARKLIERTGLEPVRDLDSLRGEIPFG